ncbi:hypothetical protein ScPMuIL_008782 [Solemya velum]
MAIASSHLSTGMMSDDMSEPSSPESTFDSSDLLSSSVNDDITAQLAAAGPIGVAAAAAIASGRKRKHPHHFETNPSRRKRQQTRLLRKLKATIEEYTTRVGQQAVVLCCTPGKSAQSSQSSSFKVFGSQPLENVIRGNKSLVIQELENCLADQMHQLPAANGDTQNLHELPALVIDGIPTPVDKMTQAQLRNFIPEMLKYSTGRSKPGWGKPECRPVWWPNDLPWANVRSDARTEEDKKRVSWTEALRTIVKNCYKHHGRDDLLQVFADEADAINQPTHSGDSQAALTAGTMVQTINNPDGTISIIQIDTNPNNIVTLPDGTQATVVHAVQNVSQTRQHEATQAVQTLAEVATNHHHGILTQVGQHVTPISIEMGPDQSQAMATLTGASINPNGQIILTGETGIGGIVTIPVSMYQTVTANMNQVIPMEAQQQGNMQVAMAPVEMTSGATVKNNSDVPDATQAVEVMTVDQSQ